MNFRPIVQIRITSTCPVYVLALKIKVFFSVVVSLFSDLRFACKIAINIEKISKLQENPLNSHCNITYALPL